MHDDHQRAIYDEEQISDEDFFTIKIGPLSINLFSLFFVSLGLSGAYIGYIKFIAKKDKGGACPIDHKNREEMVKLAKA